MSPVTDVLF